MVNPRQSGRRAFTLIELLVVVSIIVILIALLIPSIAAAKEDAKRTKCGANLHAIGQGVYTFSQDYNRIPNTQPQTGQYAPWFPNYIYNKDYFAFVDKYVTSEQVFACPSVGSGVQPITQNYSAGLHYSLAYSTDGGFFNNIPGPWYSDGSQITEQVARAQVAGHADTPTAATNPPGQWWFFDNMVVTSDYIWLGGNTDISPGVAPQPAYMVNRIGDTTQTGLGDDSNPPIMMDHLQINDQSGTPTYAFNHGKTWHINRMDFSTLNTTSGGAPYPGATAVGESGDVKANVLFLDGHVELKSPGPRSWASFNQNGTGAQNMFY